MNHYGRKRKEIIGDGNCLFRSFSFILFNTEDKHPYLRQAIVEVITLNEDCFKSYCLPNTVLEHAKKMKNNYVWGTQAEIFALSVLVFRPIFVATVKRDLTYYWANHMCSHSSQFKFTPLKDLHENLEKLSHLEICNVGGVHYDVALTKDGQFPTTPPFNEDRSTSVDNPVIIIMHS